MQPAGHDRAAAFLQAGRRIAEETTVAGALAALAEVARDALEGEAALVVRGRDGRQLAAPAKSGRHRRIARLDTATDTAYLDAVSGLPSAPLVGSTLGEEDARVTARALLHRAGLKYTLISPLPHPWGAHAVLAVGRKERGDPGSWDGTLLADLAAFAGAILRNVARCETHGGPPPPFEGDGPSEEEDRGERLRSLGELASGVAHDLNNLLHAVALRARVLTQKLSQDQSTVAFRADAATIERLTLSGSAAVRRLLDFARKRTAGPHEPLDPASVVDDVCSLVEAKWRRLAEMGGLSFEVRAEVDAQLRAVGDPGEIREALLNLAINALDAMPHGGALTLRAQDRLDQGAAAVSFEVEDSGVGMSPDVLERACEPFFTTKADRGGSGLGLAVVRGIAARNGGHIEIDSEEGRGTSVRLVLPATRANATYSAPVTIDRSGPIPLMDAESDETPTILRILLVEDDVDVRTTLEEWFVLHGHDVSTAGDGSEAIRHVGQRRFDVTICDLGLPGMSGWEVASALVRLQPGLPIVLVTGWGVPLDAARLKQAGVAATMSKPAPPDQLLSVCRAVIAEGRREPRSSDPRSPRATLSHGADDFPRPA
jgi:signal transduction histidine kinase/ActR/RegA family two-component response regulator